MSVKWGQLQVQPIALDRGNWLYAGSLRGGQRIAAVTGLIQSAKLNDLDPFEYPKDVMDRLPTQPARRFAELLPPRWTAASLIAK